MELLKVVIDDLQQEKTKNKKDERMGETKTNEKGRKNASR